MAERKLNLPASSTIVGATYDPETLDLTVQFKGGTYVVSQVSTIDAEAFEQAESVGKFYNSNFRNSHVVTKI